MHLRSHDGISLARSHMRRTQQVALVVARCFVLHPGCSTVVRLKHASRLRTQRASAHCISSPTLVFWDLTHQRPHSFRPRVHRAAGLLFCFFQPLLMLRHAELFSLRPDTSNAARSDSVWSRHTFRFPSGVHSAKIILWPLHGSWSSDSGSTPGGLACHCCCEA